MIKKSRLDLYLLNKGLCETRQKAQGLILAGKVRDINGKVLDKPGQQVLIGSEFFIDSGPMFVSRGGEKLLEAFKKLEIKVKDKICIDAGISTGGFTDCLLQQGAKLVYGIDVCYGQTAWKIRNNPKVILTPHIAASTTEASIVGAEMVANQLSDYLLSGKKLNTV